MAKNSVHPLTIAKKHKWGSRGVQRHFLGETTFHSEAESSLFQKHHNRLFFKWRSVKYPHDRRMNSFQVFFLNQFYLSILFCMSHVNQSHSVTTTNQKSFSPLKKRFFFPDTGRRRNSPLLIDVIIHHFFFLLQIENHISDIDNWVKVSFSIIWKNTQPPFL